MRRGWSGWPRIMGRDFADNALAIDATREGFRLTGFAGPADLNRPTAQHQYLFVNGRPVRDKLLIGAVRGAYRISWRATAIPMLALFLEAPTELVDVNVHPAKTEVRFRDAGIVRGLIVGALRTALAAARPSRLHRRSSDAALAAFRPHTRLFNVRCPWTSGRQRHAASRAALPKRRCSSCRRSPSRRCGWRSAGANADGRSLSAGRGAGAVA